MTRPFFLATLLGACGLACYAPDFKGGELHCGPKSSCPQDTHCAADNFCWPDGSDPSLASPGRAAIVAAPGGLAKGTAGRSVSLVVGAPGALGHAAKEGAHTVELGFAPSATTGKTK